MSCQKYNFFVATNAPADGSTPSEKTSVFCHHKCGWRRPRFPSKYTCFLITNMACDAPTLSQKHKSHHKQLKDVCRNVFLHWLSETHLFLEDLSGICIFHDYFNEKYAFVMRRLAVLFNSFQVIWPFDLNSKQKIPFYTNSMRHICV